MCPMSLSSTEHLARNRQPRPGDCWCLSKSVWFAARHNSICHRYPTTQYHNKLHIAKHKTVMSGLTATSNCNQNWTSAYELSVMFPASQVCTSVSSQSISSKARLSACLQSLVPASSSGRPSLPNSNASCIT